MLGLSSLVLLGKCLGLLRDVAIAYRFGPSDAVAAFLVVIGVQATVAIVLGDALMISTATEAATDERARPSLRTSAQLSALTAVLQAGLAPVLAPLLTGDSALSAEVARALVWTAPGTAGLIFLGGVSGVLNGRRRFVRASSLTALWSLGALLALLLLPTARTAIYGGWSFSIAVTALGGFLTLPRVRVARRPTFGRAIGGTVLPIAMASTLNQFSFVIERRAASALGNVAVVGVGFAYKLVALPLSVLVGGLSLWVLPHFIESATHSPTLFRNRVSHVALTVLALMTSCALVLIAFGETLSSWAFERGAFGPDLTASTSEALAGYAFGLPAMAGYVIFVRAGQALRLYRHIIAGSAGGMVATAASVGALTSYFGTFGITLATSFGNALACALVAVAVMTAQKHRFAVSEPQ